tara:strand:+ start:209 stop:469 length:261 start_codon:yes stop_codon:yes gene_type:complete
LAEINRKQLIGQVLESGMHKTTIVRVDSRGPHPVYKKYVTQSKKYYIHDPQNECKPGDKVSNIECRPMSKLKRWRLKRIEKRAIEI